MSSKRREPGLPAAWWAAILVFAVVGMVLLSAAMFSGTFRSYIPVTLTSDRAGLVMESGGKVKLRGVEVGRVSEITGGASTKLALQLDPDQISHIPANVEAEIRATTAFGAKYVDLIYPEHPSGERLTAGTVLKSRNVSTEVNTVFENLLTITHRIDPAKLNAVLSALAEAVRGRGEQMGRAIVDADVVLQALNERSDTIRRDWQSLRGFADTYNVAANDIVTVLDAAATTSSTITEHASDLDALLVSTIGLSNAGVELLAPNQRDLVDAINVLRPTIALLREYQPEYTCTLQGAVWYLKNGGIAAQGGNGRSVMLDAGIAFGNNLYKYPENLPIVAAKGGPGGKPSCGSLPDASKMFPVRQLVTNTGWGTGMDIRPNPGIGSPCYVDFLPATREVPEPPKLRQCLPGPAPGPVVPPGMPPYGAAMYGPGGVPLWPGLPPAPAPAAAAESGPALDPAPAPGPPSEPGPDPGVLPEPREAQTPSTGPMSTGGQP